MQNETIDHKPVFKNCAARQKSVSDTQKIFNKAILVVRNKLESFLLVTT